LSQLAAPHSGVTNNNSNSKKCSRLEEENSILIIQLSEEGFKSLELKEELKAYNKKFEKIEKELNISKTTLATSHKKVCLVDYVRIRRYTL
jgi:hypothetical protein